MVRHLQLSHKRSLSTDCELPCDRCYKTGLFVFFISAAAAIFSVEPELPSKRPKRFVLAASKGTWSSAHMALALISLVSALLVGIGAHGMFSMDTDDFLYGSGAGQPPPLGPLQNCELRSLAHLTCAARIPSFLTDRPSRSCALYARLR